MLAHALHDHYKRKKGLPPKRFEMHPAIFCELKMDERMKYMLFDQEKPTFMGVPIAVDVQADRLKMITTDNAVEYL